MVEFDLAVVVQSRGSDLVALREAVGLHVAGSDRRAVESETAVEVGRAAANDMIGIDRGMCHRRRAARWPGVVRHRRRGADGGIALRAWLSRLADDQDALCDAGAPSCLVLRPFDDDGAEEAH